MGDPSGRAAPAEWGPCVLATELLHAADVNMWLSGALAREPFQNIRAQAETQGAFVE